MTKTGGTLKTQQQYCSCPHCNCKTPGAVQFTHRLILMEIMGSNLTSAHNDSFKMFTLVEHSMLWGEK